MLDSLIGEVGSRLGLGDQARPLVQMLLGRIADPASGGVSGFLDRFRSAGLGDMVTSWLGSGSATPIVPSTEQVQAALGDGGSFLSKAASSLGLPHEKVGMAVAALIPMLISRLTSGGSVPSVLPPEFASLAREGQSLLGMGAAGLGAATAAASAGAARVGGAAAAAAAPVLAQAGNTGGGIGKWLPWLIGALVVIFGINYCSKQKEAAPAPASPTAAAPAVPAPASPAPAAPAPAATPAPDASAAPAAIPTGAAVQDGVEQGMPLLRVFFDSGKTDVAPEFAEKSKAMVEYLKANADVKAVVSGFNDPTGDAAKNAELSKHRAQAVRAALVQAGVAEDRTVLEKPAQATDTAASNAALRRVDVVLRK
jgi:outer membrane protein OmpA-like peptidoglycan-associated protein/uncharacterized protein YidB (DUF937 family)